MAEYQTLDLLQDDANLLWNMDDECRLFLFPDPKALQDVLEAHNQYDAENEPLILNATDYATYIEMVA